MGADDDEKAVHGRYEILEPAGDGGMAKVYRAVTRGAAGFQRPVAIKRVHEHLAGSTEFVRMFIEEARVCSELDHPNIVQVHDFGVDRNGYYLVMEWVDGLHLGQYVHAFAKRKETLPYRLALAIAAQVLSGLSEAHERVGADGNVAPVFHRDVTPHNILVSVTGVAKLTDFGLARAMDRARMTSPDVVKGKLSYLAPELVQGKPASARSDIYALGIVLWEALTGERLYAGETDQERIRKVRMAEVPPLRERRKDLPENLIAVVDQALRPDPSQRFESAELMARELLRIVGADPVSARELGQSVVEARVALGLTPRSVRPPSAPGPTQSREVLMHRVVVVKPPSE
jgi:eukaryotic-like serine/threonine-protein kinase